MSQRNQGKSRQTQSDSSDNTKLKASTADQITPRRAPWVLEIGALVAVVGVVVGLLMLLPERVPPPLAPSSGTTGHQTSVPGGSSSPSGGVTEPPEQWDVPDPDTADMQLEFRENLLDARAEVLARPADAEAWGSFGVVLDAHKIYDAAEVCYRRARTLEPGQFLYSYLLAIVLDVQGGSVDELVTLYRQAGALAPHYAQAAWRLGDALVRRGGEYPAAREAFQKAIEVDPELAMAHRSLGQVLLSLGDHQAAITQLERAAELTADDGGIYEALARAYGLTGQDRRARDADQKARAYEHQVRIPDPVIDQLHNLSVSSPVAYRRGKKFMEAGDYKAAIPELLVAEKAHTDDPLVRVYLAEAYRRIGELEEADRRLSDALSLRHDAVVAYLELGRLRMAQGKPDEAVEFFQEAHDLRPDHPMINLELAQASVRTSEFQNAISAFECASENRELSARSHVNWGFALRKVGALGEAIEHLRRAVEMAPEYADARAQLGLALTEAGQSKEAMQQIKRATEINPNHPIARRLAQDEP